MTQSTSISHELHQAVSRIDRPCDFSTKGTVPFVFPGLEISGLGAIGLPLNRLQAEELKSHCQQAPYGKGEATLVDVNVRRVWHLKPDQFALTNPGWSESLQSIVSRVQDGLGLQDQPLEAHLYDLLLYEESGFFLPHRDGEKLDRMVATLIVVLPSAFEGGELVVRHDGQQQVIAFGGVSECRFQTQYAAFYADCEHEVKPIRKGYRLCLVYNLTLAMSMRPAREGKPAAPKPAAASKRATKSNANIDPKSTTGTSIAISAPRAGEHITEISRVLKSWSQANENDVPEKLAIRLDHQYTKDGLTWDALKGADRMKARALADAAEQSGCHAFLALLTYWESGSSESYDDYDYSRRYGSRGRRNSRYDDVDDPDESEIESDDGGILGKYEMGEVYDESLTAEQLTSIDGESLAVKNLPVRPDEFVPADGIRSVKPEEDHEGYTGNAGMTLERWYRHAVILLWTRRRHFDVLCSCGSREAVKGLLPLIGRLRQGHQSDAVAMREECLQFANRIIAGWPENIDGRPIYDARTHEIEDTTGFGAEFLNSLMVLDDSDLISAFFRRVLAVDASIDPGPSLTSACQTFGWKPIQRPLEVAFAVAGETMLQRNARLLVHLAETPAAIGKSSTKGSRSTRSESNQNHDELCRCLATTLFSTLTALDLAKSESYYSRPLDRAVFLADFVRVLVTTNQNDLLSQLVAHALKLEEEYPLIMAHVAALSQLATWLRRHLKQPCVPIADWISAVSLQLATRTAQEPQPPADFRRQATLECKCADCKAVNTFLRDPSSPTFRLRARQQIRDHVNNEIINSPDCDLTTTTDCKGSPHTLVCTKTTRSFEQSLKTYHEDLEHLATIQSLAASLPK